MTSHFNQFCYQGTKTRPSNQTWLSQNTTQINSFCNQTFDTSFWMHLWQFPTKIAPKPRLHFFTNFATKAQKANPPNLANQTPTKINSFCNQTFHTSFCIHLWQFPTKIAQKPWLHFFTNFLPRHKKPIHPTWLSQNPTKINSLSNQTFDTSFFMHLWQFPTKIAQKPWLHFFTNFATKSQKANPPNLAKPKPNQDQFLLQPNFSDLILHTFLTIPH